MLSYHPSNYTETKGLSPDEIQDILRDRVNEPTDKSKMLLRNSESAMYV